MKNKAAFLVDKGKIEMGEKEIPEVGKGQVLIKVKTLRYLWFRCP